MTRTKGANMTNDGILELRWQGESTTRAVVDALAQSFNVRVVLPASYNHALFREFNPDASPSASESIDIGGGPEMLRTVSRVPGLEPLASLVEPVSRAGASVRLSSPPMLEIFHVDA